MNTEKKAPLSLPELVLAFLFGCMIVVTALGVFFRYVINRSLSWNIELARFIFTWCTFLGAVIAMRQGVHIRIDLLVDRVSPKVRRVLDIVNHVSVMVFTVLITILGFELVLRTGGTISPALSLPLNLVFYLALPATFVLGCMYSIVNVAKDLKDLLNRTGDA